MRLKHLTLRGFKSFADRTRLDFASGVNVVVGPNGSGKSNILDAIAWVMGTQATRSLRTEKMEDVVFAGTATRPALSRAEVQLTFDNEDQASPLDLAEITITRRLFRDGTSEYELNGVPCRLLDIQELLSDGGIGRHQHVLVGQGQVGDVLNARPEDHRSVIEEAAGVTKHRSRRDRAVRRLERTDHDMERLDDILSEKRRALRPLRRQAKAAERHDSVRDRARALRLYLGGEEIRSIRSRLASAATEREAALEGRNEADAGLTDLKAELEALRAQAGDVGADLTRDTAAAARLETVRERLTRIATVARERRRAYEARSEGADERKADLELERDELVEAIAATTALFVESDEDAGRRETALRALEDEERSIAEQVQLPTEGIVANLRGDLRSLETGHDRDRHERERVESRIAVVTARIDDELAELERLNTEIQRVDGATSDLQARYERARDERAAAQTAWEAHVAADERARLDLARGEARVEALEAALDGAVDADAAAAALGVIGDMTTLVEALDVPSDLAKAVDAALGRWRDALVAGDVHAIADVAAAVKGGGSGGITIVTKGGVGSDAVEAAAAFGIATLVDRLGPSADLDLANTYLGRCVVVEGWSMAQRIVERFPRVMAVTPEGDVVAAHGMVIAHPDGVGPAALEAARVAVEVALRDRQRTSSHVVASHRTFEELRTAERSALEVLEAAEAELAGFTEAMSLTQRSSAASHDERERLDARMAALDEAMEDRTNRITSLRERVAEFEGEEAARQAAWDALNARRDEIATRRDDARRLLEEAAARRASVAERRRLSEQRLAAVDADLAQLVLIPHSETVVASLGAIEASAERAIATVTTRIEELRARQRDLRLRAGSANTDLAAAEALREELETSHRGASERLGTLEVELAELRVRLESAAEALRRDADVGEAEALAAPRPEAEEDADLSSMLEALEADLRRMGPINPLAAAEHAELAAEVEELEAQLGDLAASRSELRKVISALDDKMATLFEEAFTEIAAFYHENFSLVFPGGTGSLMLTDPSDPMTTGVEVRAQPAGKKVGKLSLLSGGERSLAALAFLFAVFRSRPSPFYVLDEVEAALDDANLHRFLRLVDTLRNNTQLVIITHQQQTMEAADVLYGVTMEPGESSKVLSKRMTPVRVTA